MNAGALTSADLDRALAALGVAPGPPLIVHSSLGSLGWVTGGAEAVVDALLRAMGPRGTLAMPAATPQCTEPPPFDRRQTPTPMGAIAEAFRRRPDTLRSDHPLESVCAAGSLASDVTASHPLEFSEGPGTPFGRLHDLDARILLLGVEFNRCTALHYAETLSPHRRTMRVRAPLREGHDVVWREWTNVADDHDTLFPVIGEAFVEAGHARVGRVGNARSYFFSMRSLVLFAASHFAPRP